MPGEIPSPKLQGELGNNTLNTLQKAGLNISDLRNLSKMAGNQSKINISSGEKNTSSDKPDWISKVDNRTRQTSESGNQTTNRSQTSENRSTTQNQTMNDSFNTSFNQSQIENLLNTTQRDENKSETNRTEEEKSSEEKKKEDSKSSSSGSGGSGGATSGLSMDQSSTGGQVSLSNKVVAIVETPQIRKLKMASYDGYSGDGWNRNYEMRDYSEPVIKAEGKELVQKIHLNRTLENLVSVWKPQSIDGIESEIKISDGGQIQVSEPLDPGDTYTVTSRVSRPSSSELKSTKGSYPEKIEQKYTKLPDSVPSRVKEKTSEIVEGEESTYAKVKEIEQWMAENKNYSLNAPDNPSGMGLAEHFIFNTDKGYCAYYATTTAVMLRTQDIPTRYVSGYAGGERNENGNYVVRKKHAHAWIEVYFPEHGWVSFDPTSGSSSEYQEAHQSQQEDSPTKEDIKKEEDQQKKQDKKKQENKTEKQENQTKEENNQKPDYSLKLVTEEPVPGSPATVKLVKTVSGQTTSVSGAEIAIENEELTTSDKGTASSTVPYEEWFNSSYPGHDAELGVKLPTEIEVETEGRIPGEEANVTARIGDVPVDGGSVQMNEVYTTQTSAGSAKVTLPWSESVNISISKGAASGRTSVDVIDDLEVYNLTRTLPSRDATFGVKVRQKPVKRAKAEFNSSKLGRTSETGTFTAEMPSRPGNYTYSFSKGEASGSIKVEIENLTVEADPQGPVPLPMGETAVRVKVGQEPAGNVTVSYSGRDITTDEKGVVEVSNPLKNRVSFTASEFGQRDTAEVTNLFLNLAVIIFSISGLLAIPSYLLYRRGIQLSDFKLLLKKLRDRGIGLVFDAAILFGEKLSGLLGKAYHALRHPKIAYNRLKQRAKAASTLRSISSDSETSINIDEAWNVLKQNTTLRNLPYHTPGEIKRHAINVDGLPEEAVDEVVDAFRGEKYAHRKLETDFSSYVKQLDEGGVSP
jgi:hypothetical protein